MLKDQLTLLECAARELANETLPLRLSTRAGMTGLGVFGDFVRTAPSLQEAIMRCNVGMASLLQSVTHMSLLVSGDIAKWTYQVTDSARVGRQEPLVIDGDPERTDAHLPMIHIAFSNLKTWLLGTHHGVSPHHLQAYLNEFVFRFNRTGETPRMRRLRLSRQA